MHAKPDVKGPNAKQETSYPLDKYPVMGFVVIERRFSRGHVTEEGCDRYIQLEPISVPIDGGIESIHLRVGDRAVGVLSAPLGTFRVKTWKEGLDLGPDDDLGIEYPVLDHYDGADHPVDWQKLAGEAIKFSEESQARNKSSKIEVKR
jgi:hypothetical protein